jgi:hypothetical protein
MFASMRRDLSPRTAAIKAGKPSIMVQRDIMQLQ